MLILTFVSNNEVRSDQTEEMSSAPQCKGRTERSRREDLRRGIKFYSTFQKKKKVQSLSFSTLLLNPFSLRISQNSSLVFVVDAPLVTPHE